MQKMIAIVLIGLLASICLAEEPAAEQPAGEAVKLEIRFAQFEPGEGLTEMQVPGSEQKVYVAGTAALTGKDVRSARVTMGPNGRPQIAVMFDETGTKIFAQVTGKSIGKPLAILVDGTVVSAPTVRSKISGGLALITGNFTEEETKRIVACLNGAESPQRKEGTQDEK